MKSEVRELSENVFGETRILIIALLLLDCSSKSVYLNGQPKCQAIFYRS